MTRRHKKSEAIWLFNYPSLAAMSDCADKMVWLSERDLNIIWQATINIDKFRSRVFNSVDGEEYDIVSRDEFSTFQEWVSDLNVNLGGFNMCNEILLGIAQILQQLVDKPCCPGESGGGSRGAGDIPAPPSTQTSTTDDRLGDPPPGFEDWDEYDQFKCDMAHKILDDLIVDMATLFTVGAGVTASVTLATLLLTALLTPIGWAALITLAGVALSLFATGITVSELTSVLEDNRDSLVCGMLSGSSVTDSISFFADVVQDICEADAEISAFGDVPIFLAVNTIMGFASIDSFNRLYEPPPYEIPTGNDCSGCNPPWWDCITADHVISSGSNFVTFEAFDVGDGNFVASVGKTGLADWGITLVSGSLVAPTDVPTFKASENDDSEFACGAGNAPGSWTTEYNSWPVTFNTQTWQWRSSAVFVVTATWA